MDSGGPLLARQRHELILERISAHGAVRVAEVVDVLGVSEMTVRRDIGELAARGLLERVHGGAVAPAAAEPLFSAKAGRHERTKTAIGRHAARRVAQGDTVALGGGTTTLAVARALVDLPFFGSLTVVTNSLPAADVLHQASGRARTEGRSAPSVILTGGERTRSDALVGPVAVEALRGMRVSWAFLGAHGLDVDLGLVSPNLAEAATNAALVAAARRVVAVADVTKWGVPGLRAFCSPEELAALVTDAPPAPAVRETLAGRGVVVELAEEKP